MFEGGLNKHVFVLDQYLYEIVDKPSMSMKV